MPILSKLAYANFGQTPANPAWAKSSRTKSIFPLRAPEQQSGGSHLLHGSRRERRPNHGGLTLPTNTLCQAVGASSSINLQWSQLAGISIKRTMDSVFLYCFNWRQQLCAELLHPGPAGWW